MWWGGVVGVMENEWRKITDIKLTIKHLGGINESI